MARTKRIVVTGRVLELRCAEHEGFTTLLAAEPERHVIATWGDHSRPLTRGGEIGWRSARCLTCHFG